MPALIKRATALLTSAVAAGAITLTGGAASAHAASCPTGDCSQSAEVSVDFQTQINGYYCGPASTHLALSGQGYQVDQDTLAGLLGTTVDGTPSIDNVTSVLNSVENSGFYQSKWIGGDTATQDQINLLQSDVVYDIPRNYPIVANVVGTGVDTNGGSHSYSGGHYLTVVGFQDGGATVEIDDVANGSNYWMNVGDLATWIAGRGYSA